MAYILTEKQHFMSNHDLFYKNYKFTCFILDIPKLFAYNSRPQTETFVFVLLAQLVEHVTFNDVADGSNPSQDTIRNTVGPIV